jgi:hypothetical protein
LIINFSLPDAADLQANDLSLAEIFGTRSEGIFQKRYLQQSKKAELASSMTTQDTTTKIQGNATSKQNHQLQWFWASAHASKTI